MGFRGLLAAALGALAIVAGGAPALADHRDLLGIWVGHSDIDDFDEETVEGRIEYTSRLTDFAFKPFFGGVGPMAGIMVSGKGSVFAYAGIYGDFFVGEHFVIRPEGGLGAFKPGDAKDLGGVFEIHAALGFAYVFDNEARLGVTATHISNTGVHNSNPGLDSLLLSYSIPIGPLF